MIERGVSFESPVEIVPEPVASIEFIDKFKDSAGAETVNALDRALTAQASQGLRLRGGNRICGLFQTRFDFCRTAGAQTRRERRRAHSAVSEVECRRRATRY